MPSDAIRPTSCGRRRRPARSAAAPVADVLADVVPTCWPGATGRVISIRPSDSRRVFGGHDRIERRAGTGAPVMMRIATFARHGVPRRAGRASPGRHGKGERVVLACAGRLGAAQRIAVHRRAIESRHVERARRHRPRGSGRRPRRAARVSAPSANGVPVDPLEDCGDLAPPAEAVHAHVGYGGRIVACIEGPEARR